MHQPSPCWREYGLRHLRFYTLEQRVSSSLKPPPPLTDQQRKLAAAIMEEVSPVLRSELSALAAPPRGVVTAHLIEHPQAPTCVPPPHGGGRDTRSSSRVLQLTSLAQTASLLRETAASTHGRPPTMRRRGDSSALSLAPYLVGEWSDELRLTGVLLSLASASLTLVGHSTNSSSRARCGSCAWFQVSILQCKRRQVPMACCQLWARPLWARRFSCGRSTG